MGLTWASLGRRVEVASWGLARGPESRSSVEEGWGQVAQGCSPPHCPPQWYAKCWNPSLELDVAGHL